MPCTTLLVGKKASYDGSTIIARTDDGFFDEKRLIVVNPKDQPRKYKSVISHVEIDLPDNPMRYTSNPSVNPTHGIWAANGVNEANVAMTATETITSNYIVQAADPYVNLIPAKSKKEKEVPGGIGEEDIVVLVIPYVRSAKEGAIRLGELLEKYGTYEANGIAFSDKDEIWWLETIGGHNWIARRIKDDEYVVAPNQFAMDKFDFEDAYGEQKEFMCSKGLKELMDKYHINFNQGNEFNPRNAFGSHSDSDHVYNTPRAWFMCRYFNPNTYKWDGENADFTPESDNIPFSLVPERKITVEDVKYVLSSYYQGTPYDPTKKHAEKAGIYRPIGIARTGVTSIIQIRDYVPSELSVIEWVCFGCNAYNAMLPIYTNVSKMPSYIANVTMDCTTDNFYWPNRLIGAMADANYGTSIQLIERYQRAVPAKCLAIVNEYDNKMIEANKFDLIEEANEKICEVARKEVQKTLNAVLRDASIHMKVNYSRADN